MSNKNLSKGSQIALIIGAGLILFGAIQLLQIVMGPLWAVVSHVWRIVESFAWPILVIALGGFIAYRASQGGFSHLSGKKLYRSQSDKWVSGVLGGLGEYLEFDPTLLRLIYIVFLLASLWFAVVVYFVLAVVIPENPYLPAEPK